MMLTRMGLRLAEQGTLPDALIAAGIRQMLRARLRDLRRAPEPPIRSVLQAMGNAPIALSTPTANAQHYEVPTAFFQRVLGRRLKYSCAWWPPGVTSLDAAEEAMLDLTIARAGLADGMSILDLGCGWGSLTLALAERFPQSHIVAVSNSATQRAFIEAACQDRGWHHVRVITCDMNDLALHERFDRVISIEMFEHMRNYPALLARIASWLTPVGQCFVHLFCHRHHAYFFEDRGNDDWMARQFFTGGLMPSADLLPRVAHGLRVSEQWPVNGSHYAKTANAWLSNLDRHASELGHVLQDDTQLRRWRLFFLACRETFAFRGGKEWFVMHYRLQRR